MSCAFCPRPALRGRDACAACLRALEREGCRPGPSRPTAPVLPPVQPGAPPEPLPEEQLARLCGRVSARHGTKRARKPARKPRPPAPRVLCGCGVQVSGPRDAWRPFLVGGVCGACLEQERARLRAERARRRKA